MMENGGKSGIDTWMKRGMRGNGRSVFRMIVGTVQLARAFQSRQEEEEVEEEGKIRFRGWNAIQPFAFFPFPRFFQPCPHRWFIPPTFQNKRVSP